MDVAGSKKRKPDSEPVTKRPQKRPKRTGLAARLMTEMKTTNPIPKPQKIIKNTVKSAQDTASPLLKKNQSLRPSSHRKETPIASVVPVEAVNRSKRQTKIFNNETALTKGASPPILKKDKTRKNEGPRAVPSATSSVVAHTNNPAERPTKAHARKSTTETQSQFHEADGLRIPLFHANGKKKACARLAKGLMKYTKDHLIDMVLSYSPKEERAKYQDWDKNELTAWIEAVETKALGANPKSTVAPTQPPTTTQAPPPPKPKTSTNVKDSTNKPPGSPVNSPQQTANGSANVAVKPPVITIPEDDHVSVSVSSPEDLKPKPASPPAIERSDDDNDNDDDYHIMLQLANEYFDSLERSTQEAVTQEAVPQETIPQETISQETIPQETVIQEPVLTSSEPQTHETTIPYKPSINETQQEPVASSEKDKKEGGPLRHGEHGWNYTLHKWNFEGDTGLENGVGHSVEDADWVLEGTREFRRKYPGYGFAHLWPCGCQRVAEGDESEEE